MVRRTGRNVAPWLERRAWLLQRISDEGQVDVLNRTFVDDYVEMARCSVQLMIIGANVCRLLREDLRRLRKLGFVNVRAYGLPSGNWQPGFPKWVKSYSLSAEGRRAMQELP